MRLDACPHTIGDRAHTGDNQGVGPIALERGREEQAPFLNRLDIARNHNARNERWNTQFSRKLGFEFCIGLSERPTMRGFKRCQGGPPPLGMERR